VRLGLVVEGEGGRPGLVMNLPVTHMPFSVGVSSETSATNVCVSTFSFFLREKGSAPRTCC
jgi:hypothetical protein